jgi:hypothetical protein
MNYRYYDETELLINGDKFYLDYDFEVIHEVQKPVVANIRLYNIKLEKKHTKSFRIKVNNCAIYEGIHGAAEGQGFNLSTDFLTTTLSVDAAGVLKNSIAHEILNMNGVEANDDGEVTFSKGTPLSDYIATNVKNRLLKHTHKFKKQDCLVEAIEKILKDDAEMIGGEEKMPKDRQPLNYYISVIKNSDGDYVPYLHFYTKTNMEKKEEITRKGIEIQRIIQYLADDTEVKIMCMYNDDIMPGTVFYYKGEDGVKEILITKVAHNYNKFNGYIMKIYGKPLSSVDLNRHNK